MIEVKIHGAMTLSIMAFSLMTLSIKGLFMPLSITALSIMTCSLMTLIIKG